jgi:hypothetical protein
MGLTVKPIGLTNNSFFYRSYNAVLKVLPSALKTAVWLVKITIPLSFIVFLLGYFGVVGLIAEFLNPVFGVVGLPGEASLVFITALFLNIYSAIAVITQLPLTIREITILAVMCLIAHNIIVETAVQVKTGSKAWQIVTLRLSMAIAAGFVLNLIMPEKMIGSTQQLIPIAVNGFKEMFFAWGISAIFLSIKIAVLVTALTILQQLLKEFGVIKILSKVLSPALKIFGLPKSASFLWIVANILGLTFGSAVMVEEVKSGSITKHDANLLNFHIAISHSNLEDLLLFAAIGISVPWLLFPRLLIAAIVVWMRRWLSNIGQ